jgi:hypothetical protein
MAVAGVVSGEKGNTKLFHRLPKGATPGPAISPKILFSEKEPCQGTMPGFLVALLGAALAFGAQRLLIEYSVLRNRYQPRVHAAPLPPPPKRKELEPPPEEEKPQEPPRKKPVILPVEEDDEPKFQTLVPNPNPNINIETYSPNLNPKPNPNPNPETQLTLIPNPNPDQAITHVIDNNTGIVYTIKDFKTRLEELRIRPEFAKYLFADDESYNRYLEIYNSFKNYDDRKEPILNLVRVGNNQWMLEGVLMNNVAKALNTKLVNMLGAEYMKKKEIELDLKAYTAAIWRYYKYHKPIIEQPSPKQPSFIGAIGNTIKGMLGFNLVYGLLADSMFYLKHKKWPTHKVERTYVKGPIEKLYDATKEVFVDLSIGDFINVLGIYESWYGKRHPFVAPQLEFQENLRQLTYEQPQEAKNMPISIRRIRQLARKIRRRIFRRRGRFRRFRRLPRRLFRRLIRRSRRLWRRTKRSWARRRFYRKRNFRRNPFYRKIRSRKSWRITNRYPYRIQPNRIFTPLIFHQDWEFQFIINKYQSTAATTYVERDIDFIENAPHIWVPICINDPSQPLKDTADNGCPITIYRLDVNGNNNQIYRIKQQVDNDINLTADNWIHWRSRYQFYKVWGAKVTVKVRSIAAEVKDVLQKSDGTVITGPDLIEPTTIGIVHLPERKNADDTTNYITYINGLIDNMDMHELKHNVPYIMRTVDFHALRILDNGNWLIKPFEKTERGRDHITISTKYIRIPDLIRKYTPGYSKRTFRYDTKYNTQTSNPIDTKARHYVMLFFKFNPRFLEKDKSIGNYQARFKIILNMRIRFWTEFWEIKQGAQRTFRRAVASEAEVAHTYADYKNLGEPYQSQYFLTTAPELDPTIGKDNAETLTHRFKIQ